MEWDPVESVFSVKGAWSVPSSALVARGTPPSLKVTVPAGELPPGAVAVTVAVKVTDWPKAVGLVEEVRVVVELAGLTVWVSGEAELSLLLKLASSLWTAVMEWAPTTRELLVRVAEPELSVPVPSVLVPSWKVTVPVGVPPPGDTGLTVAVNVTGWPKTVGVREVVTAMVVSAWLTVWVSTPEVLVLKFGSPL